MSEKFLSKMSVVCILFDELSFKRHGFKNDNEVEFSFEIDTLRNIENENFHKVVIKVGVSKEAEYELMVEISGVFEFVDSVPEEIKEDLLTKNAVAILMPYIRSEISILTAQPDTDSLVLPILDISKMMSNV